MATFGNTSTATSSFVLGNATGPVENIAGGRFTISEDGIPTRISAYCAKGGAATHSVKCAIYEYDAGGNHVLVVETDAVTVNTIAWYKFPINSFVQLTSGTEYILCAIGDDGATGSVNLRYTASTGTGISKTATYPTFPDPLSSVTGDTNLYAIFCHYIPGTATGLHFGNETVEASDGNFEATIFGGIETMGGASGVANAIVARLVFNVFPSSDSVAVKAAIYTNAADPALVAESNELTIDPYNAHAGIGFEDGWYIFPFASPPTLSASTAYTLCVWTPTDAAGTVAIRYKTTGGSGAELESLAYGTWPDPMSNTNVPDWRLSIFVDYELAPSGVRLLASTGVGV